MTCLTARLFAAAAAAAAASFAVLATADTQCYGINGQKSTGTACNATADGQPGSHAACCNAGKQDACLATGLCYASQRRDNHTFRAEGCTDPTGMDPACPQYCGMTSQAIAAPIQSKYSLVFCGSDAWCCCSGGNKCNQTDCCTRNFTLSRGLGTVVRQLSPTDNATLSASDPLAASSCSRNSTGGNGGNDGNGGSNRDKNNDNDNGKNHNNRNMKLITAIFAGALGCLLLASLIALGFTIGRARQLRREANHLRQLLMQRQDAAARKLSVVSSMTGRGNGGSSSAMDESPSDLFSPVVYSRPDGGLPPQPVLQRAATAQTAPRSLLWQAAPPSYPETQPPPTPTWTTTATNQSISRSLTGSITDNIVSTGTTGTTGTSTSRHSTAELAGQTPVVELPAEKWPD